MNEERLLEEIFDEKWMGKYTIRWCELCETHCIECLDESCKGTSCNGGGCEKCRVDFDEFLTTKRRPTSYLNDEEKRVYRKIWYLKKYIKESLAMGHKEIDWQALETAGKLCENAYQYFPKETKNLKRYEDIRN